MAAVPPFSRLRFGRLDAHDEAVSEPDLLLEGFFDFRDAAAAVESSEAFLLLGPKGAGKTAVLEHLRLSWSGEYDRFFSLWDLRGFPISDVRNVKTGESPGLGRTQSSWEFLLLLRLLDSLHGDNSIALDSSVRALRDALIAAGLLATEWKTKVTEWTKMTAKVSLPLGQLGAEYARNPVNLLQVVEIIKKSLSNLSVKSRHVIALDGLDSFFFESESQWESLSGLVQAAEELNRFFRGQGIPALVLVALRSDIYNVLPSAETNKFKNYASPTGLECSGSGGRLPAMAGDAQKGCSRLPTSRIPYHSVLHSPRAPGIQPGCYRVYT